MSNGSMEDQWRSRESDRVNESKGKQEMALLELPCVDQFPQGKVDNPSIKTDLSSLKMFSKSVKYDNDHAATSDLTSCQLPHKKC